MKQVFNEINREIVELFDLTMDPDTNDSSPYGLKKSTVTSKIWQIRWQVRRSCYPIREGLYILKEID
jgi:hypothetical protein